MKRSIRTSLAGAASVLLLAGGAVAAGTTAASAATTATCGSSATDWALLGLASDYQGTFLIDGSAPRGAQYNVVLLGTSATTTRDGWNTLGTSQAAFTGGGYTWTLGSSDYRLRSPRCGSLGQVTSATMEIVSRDPRGGSGSGTVKRIL